MAVCLASTSEQERFKIKTLVKRRKMGEKSLKTKKGFKCLRFEVVFGCQVSLSGADAGTPPPVWAPTHVLYLFWHTTSWRITLVE